MSSVIENQTLLTGRVRSREPHVSTERWDVLHLDVSAARGDPCRRLQPACRRAGPPTRRQAIRACRRSATGRAVANW